jgi:hypothetical protein
MTLDSFLLQIRHSPDTIEFNDTLTLIDALYDFTPTSFRNGTQVNAAGENNGSCKIFAFAQLHGLTQAETLACFGHYYREDVLGEPAGSGHANIRNFMVYGWQGMVLDSSPLAPK